jgi:hypothetical protein
VISRQRVASSWRQRQSVLERKYRPQETATDRGDCTATLGSNRRCQGREASISIACCANATLVSAGAQFCVIDNLKDWLHQPKENTLSKRHLSRFGEQRLNRRGLSLKFGGRVPSLAIVGLQDGRTKISKYSACICYHNAFPVRAASTGPPPSKARRSRSNKCNANPARTSLVPTARS